MARVENQAPSDARPALDTVVAPRVAPSLVLPPFEPVDGNAVRLLRDGRMAYPAMLAAIESAEREIVLEMYWFQGDIAGLMFRDALARKAAQGVAVRVTYDAVGSLGAPASMWEPLRAAGGEVFEYNPLRVLSAFLRWRRLNVRDHRKILVVDGAIGFTGGMNIGNPWLPREQGGQDWRDDAIEVRGHAAAELRSLFYETWRRSGRPMPSNVTRLGKPGRSAVRVLANRHGLSRGIRHNYLTAIRRAKHHIDITNPYFLPGPIFLSALRRAQARGVEVRILIPGQNDVWVVSMAMSSVIGRLLKAKARVFAFQGRVLHAKSAVFDETLAMVGTYNLDPRSRRYNRECNVAVVDPAIARLARASFEADLASATELSLSTWKQRSLAHRFVAWVAYLLRQFL